MKNKKIRKSRIALWIGLGFVAGLVISGRGDFAVLVALVFGLARFMGEWLGRTSTKPSTAPVSPSLQAHYVEAGLSDSEITLFRETMETASEQINAIEATINAVPKLKSLALQTDLLPIMHAYFKAIVQAPKRLTEAAPFIYEILPNLNHLTDRYQTITNHEVKTQETYTVLTQAETAITAQAQTINEQYQAFVADDLEDLAASVSLSQKQIQSQSHAHPVPLKETEALDHARE
ncbi:5-bromo-4-chloroindolyl phosphate hydrolysis family protein [Lacticaseibacillus brantae]|uniref:5-bromo-4-chloroindolyl phosphate hydrolysis protein n=1 Tax=Lacticaseibacillus brantae DSM 23927 TaxID=1423727 RepID=A0A0R2AYW2_9LACO|nr:5-bromo-4-chloroindolyl phosphate hydrolysis family protein [Lacticaseibacillus brantae]KRM72520.1 5-bromo-4-chloroindolyl phosphate hydrolysis protein [Lacticaseibacillus brantae DSM 23927]